ncbi:MAG: hypothetical protein IPP71_00045 [Bacteroidetes bacterium]|nr:hypothetical protein [Bacteroidota bacterium]
MRNEELFRQAVTQAYAHMMKSKMQEKFPDFYFEKGPVIYDYDAETYVRVGYSEDETSILNAIAQDIDFQR